MLTARNAHYTRFSSQIHGKQNKKDREGRLLSRLAFLTSFQSRRRDEKTTTTVAKLDFLLAKTMKVLHAQQQQIAHQQAAAPTAPAVPAAPAPAPQQDGDTKKGAWTEEEDSALRHYIEVRKIRKRRKRGRGREGRDSTASKKTRDEEKLKKKKLEKKLRSTARATGL